MSLPYLLLGMLREPATGYDLKRAFDATLRHVWSAELSQIYPTLQRLERDGLLRSKRLASRRGPTRRLYTRTAAGRRHLLRWLRQPPEFTDQRLPWLGQLCFLAEADDVARTTGFLTELRTQFVRQLERYQDIASTWFRPEPGYPDAMSWEALHAHFTVRAGIARTSALVAWCDECLARILLRRVT
jgi:DNA-binding PadR family transcriptional regulator